MRVSSELEVRQIFKKKGVFSFRCLNEEVVKNYVIVSSEFFGELKRNDLIGRRIGMRFR